MTCVDMLNLRVPQLWTGGFFPEDVLERHRCVDRALVAAVAEMCTTSSRPRGGVVCGQQAPGRAGELGGGGRRVMLSCEVVTR